MSVCVLMYAHQFFMDEISMIRMNILFIYLFFSILTGGPVSPRAPAGPAGPEGP